MGETVRLFAHIMEEGTSFICHTLVLSSGIGVSFIPSFAGHTACLHDYFLLPDFFSWCLMNEKMYMYL